MLVHFLNLNAQDAKPVVTVSAVAMNVFYIGVDNPVSISVSGVPQDKIKATISEGTLTPKGDGMYIARFNRVRSVKIN